MKELTQKLVRSLFDYRDGELYWKVRLSHGIQVSDKWMAKIGIDNKTIYLGRFVNEMSAAKTYNEAAIELFGECAYLNEVIS